VGATLLASSHALAAPSAETPNCRALNIPAGTGGAVLDDTCETAYILPPDVGQERVTAVATNTNLNFCPGVLKITSVVNTTLSAADSIASKIKSLIDSFNPLSDQVTQLQNQLAAATAAQTAANQTVTNDMAIETTLTDNVTQAQNALTTCEALATSACTSEQQAVTDAQNALRNFILNTLAPDQRAAVAATQQVDTLSGQLANQTSNLANALTPLFNLENSLTQLETSVQEQYDQFGPLSGFVAQIVYSLPWSQLFQEYQAANPGLQLQQIPITSTNFFASVDPGLTPTAAGNIPGNIPAVLGFTIPGLPTQGAAAFPNGLGSIKPLSSSTLGSDISQQSMPFGSSVSASVNFSLVGACNFYPNGALTTPPSNINNLVAAIPANLEYQYEVVAHRRYTASYNLSQFVSHLVTVHHSGGFFSSKDVTNIVDSSSSSDWFSIKFDSDSSHFPYSADEQKQITEEVKGQLVERALLLIAVQNGYLPHAPTGNPPLSSTGVGAAAGYLTKGCGYWSWCGAAGFVLGIVNSFFGNETAVQNFQRTNNAWVTDQVTQETVLLRYGEVSFSPN
jgi:hypothetical protein